MAAADSSGFIVELPLAVPFPLEVVELLATMVVEFLDVMVVEFWAGLAVESSPFAPTVAELFVFSSCLNCLYT